MNEIEDEAEREEEFFTRERHEKLKRERLAVLMQMAATIISGWTNSVAWFVEAAEEVEASTDHERTATLSVRVKNKNKMASAAWSLVAEIEQQARIMGIVPETWGGKSCPK